MKDYFNYQGKVCVVTGSSNGMGLATTKMLVDLGAKVYAVSRSTTKVEGIEASILCDLSCKEDIDKAFAQLRQGNTSLFKTPGVTVCLPALKEAAQRAASGIDGVIIS